MLKRFLIAALVLMTACQSAAPTGTSAITPTPPQVSPSSGTTTPKWLETRMNDVSLGLWRPAGWEADSSRGLVMAEPNSSNNGTAVGGLLIYCFVPSASEFYISVSDTNYAWTVLNQVIKMPSHIGRDVSVSLPIGFAWDKYPAAYYLLTTGDGMRVMVLGLVVPNAREVVVCNVSAPASQANRIRASLPRLLNGLTINGRFFNSQSLDNLPDPLPFPHYSLTSTPEENQISANASP